MTDNGSSRRRTPGRRPGDRSNPASAASRGSSRTPGYSPRRPRGAGESEVGYEPSYSTSTHSTSAHSAAAYSDSYSDGTRAAGAGRLTKEQITRNRIIAAGALLVVVVVAIVLMLFLGGGNKDAETAGVATTEQLTQPTNPGTDGSEASESATLEEESAADSAAEQGSTTNAAKPTADLAALKQSCDLSDLILSGDSDKSSYDEGELPEFYMTVRNPTGVDCTINLKENPLRFEVYDLATNKRMWADIDCNPAVDSTKRVFPANSDVYYKATWSRTGSEPGKCTDRSAVPTGSYYLHTLIGDNYSDSHPFNLR